MSSRKGLGPRPPCPIGGPGNAGARSPFKAAPDTAAAMSDSSDGTESVKTSVDVAFINGKGKLTVGPHPPSSSSAAGGRVGLLGVAGRRPRPVGTDCDWGPRRSSPKHALSLPLGSNGPQVP